MFVTVVLAACSSTKNEDESTKIADLVDIQAKFQPKEVWSSSVEDGVSKYFSRIKPEQANGVIYSASRNGDVFAFDAKTGKKLWHTDLSDLEHTRGFFDSRQPALISGGPTIGVDNVFFGSENGKIFALNNKTGKLVWQQEIKGEVISAPALDSGILVVNTVSGVMQAFKADTGKPLWQIEQDVPALTLRGVSAPVAASGGVLIGTPSGNLAVYLLANGQSGWSTPVGEATGSTELERVIDVDSKPVIFGDRIYSVAARGHLVSIDLRSGRIVWKRQYSSYRQIAISGNTIYLTDVRGHVFAIDRIDGLEKWSQLALSNRGVTGPAVVGNYVVVGDYEGYLHWLDQSTGEIVARYRVDSSGLYATPTVFDNLLVAQSRDGDLEVIKTPSL